jgi:hypothetical protein
MSLSIASNIFVLILVYYSLFLQPHFDFQVLQFLTLESQFFDRQFLINLKISLLVFDTIHFLISPILAFQNDNFGTLLITEYGLN